MFGGEAVEVDKSVVFHRVRRVLLRNERLKTQEENCKTEVLELSTVVSVQNENRGDSVQYVLEIINCVLKLICSEQSSFNLCLPVSCVEEILKADPGQLQAEDSLYGGTPLHWAKTAEVKQITWVLWLEIPNELF